MPYRRKDSPVWWASLSGPSDQRIRRTTGTSDRKEALALEAKWKLEAYRLHRWGSSRAGSSTICFSTTSRPPKRRNEVRSAIEPSCDISVNSSEVELFKS